MEHPVLCAAAKALGQPLACRGEPGLLDRARRRACLISRMPRTPEPNTPWVRKLCAVTDRLCDSGEILVTSVGRLPFELSLWKARERGGAAVVVLPEAPTPQLENETHLRELLPENHLLVWPQSAFSAAATQFLRDRLMGELADRASLIEIRRGGNMTRVLDSLCARHCPIEHAPEPPGNDEPQPFAATPAPDEPPIFPENWDFLTHFTREAEGPWPGEPIGAYFKWLASGIPFIPRDAFATLCRILDERLLRGSSTFISGKARMVCFSAVEPAHAASLRRWRRGLGRWSLSLHGVALRREVLRKAGARPVEYVPGEALKTTDSAERCFVQLKKSSAADWSEEHEWRIHGDVDFSQVPAGDLCVLVSTPAEAAHIRKTYALAAYVLPGTETA